MKKVFFMAALLLGIASYGQGYPQMDTFTLVPSNTPASPLEGQTYYNQATNTVLVWDGTQWRDLITIDTDDQALSLSGSNLVLENGGSVDLSALIASSITDNSLSEVNQFIPNSTIRNVDVGAAGVLRLRDSDGRAHLRITSDPIAQARGTMELAEDFFLYETSGEMDDSIDVNFDFHTGTDGTLTATPNTISYNGVSLLNSDDQTAVEVPFSPSGSLISTDVQAAIGEMDTEKVGVNALNSVTGTFNVTDTTDGSGLVINSSTDQTVVRGGSIVAGNDVELVLAPNSISINGLTNADIDEIGANAVPTVSWVQSNAGSVPNNDFLTEQQLTGNYTLTALDFESGKRIVYNNTSNDYVVIVPDVAAVGEKIIFAQYGTGKIQVAMDTGVTGTSFQTIDETSTITMYKSVSGYRPVGAYDSFTLVTDPTDSPNYVGRFDPTSIDAIATVEDDPVTVWNNLNTSGVGNIAFNNSILHIEGGQRQVDLSGTAGSFGTIPNANVNYVPGTDEWTIAGRIGYDGAAAGVQQVIIGKIQLNFSASGQYAVYQQSGLLRGIIGGTTTFGPSADWSTGDTFVLTVRTTGFDLYRNDVLIITNGTLGVNTTTNDLIIGARFDGQSNNFSGSFSHIYIKNQAIDSTEASTLHNHMNGNL
ncbi:hypothetical protein FGF1_13050 [Flavobacteriaceae bacterium GF1]